LYEVITITPSLRELIAPGIPPITFKKAAEKEGFRSMTLDGIDKATEGLTTIEEVFRVAAPELEEAAQGPAEEAGKSERGVGKRVPPKTSPAVGSSTREKKVLVADDNGIILKTVSKVLKSKNYITITAENGLEALRLASEEKPDLIITDLLMPKMDGITLIKKLKDQSSTREIPIMMLTAKDEVDSEVEGIDAGADDYLTKPVNAKRLLARVSRLLAR
jgi:CheY-like chemotaxis protein